MKTYVFDIDGTICTNTYGNYEEAKPYEERIQFVNKLFNEGNKIKYFTARGSSTGINWCAITKKQLDNLCILSKKMNKSEIERRKKATTYGKYSPKFIDK